MGLTIKEVLQIEELEGIKLVAAEEKINNEIRWIHIGETISMPVWLKGGELLLTCAHGFQDNESAQEYLIRKLAANDVTALAIEPGYYFDTIPQNMIDLANQVELPLLEIPTGMPFLQITEIVIDRIIKRSSFDGVLNKSKQMTNLKADSDSKSLFSVEKEKLLFEKVKYGEQEVAFNILEEIFADMIESELEPKLITTRCLEISIMLSRAAVETGVKLKTTLELNNRFVDKLSQTINLEDKFNLTCDLIRYYINAIYEKIEIKNLKIVQEVKDFVLDNYSEKVTLEQISEYVYLSSSHLSKVFKEVTGKTIMSYVNQIRLKEAKKLLRKTDMPLNSVAELSGYYDASYLNKVFKKEVGITPGRYRLNSRK
ncbi:PucR family transcriptional regulator ligand-binding domain-containing protein [Natroniella acetigena]|uniref:PucR family transcriptional regulator ligand-binding domain-containing protein n=1 Tax=Natroniella acetigena TaxID=52004 RepID=UPI00200A7991|nr:PucR family transcriptional regulator ligand-binding domain-containing protein [Natroniella acetigena]MCK8827271.1 PucR family transcriptional regulator ligand-binding domain-containing protein [Natroniella acetigena]